MATATHHHPLEPQRLQRARAELQRLRDDAATLGALGEELAVHHLVGEDGLDVLARNWRVGRGELRGELDIVAVAEATGSVVVCEVKTRRDAGRFGGALAALTPRQRQRLRALTAAFLRDAALPYRRVRLDLVAVDLGSRPMLTHLEGAL